MAELNADTVARLIEQLAQTNAAIQTASQSSQQINQSVADLLTKLSSQTSTTSTTTQVAQEETGFGERYQTESVDRSGVMFANIKRTYDEYQQESLESIKRNRSIVDKIVSDAQQYDNARQNIANQALQNAVETANMVGKQAVRHGDVAIDRQWNVDEQAAFVTKIINDPNLEAAVKARIIESLATK